MYYKIKLKNFKIILNLLIANTWALVLKQGDQQHQNYSQ